MQLNLTAPINQLGYGVAGLNILKALWEEGVEVALFPIGGRQNVQVTNQDDMNVVAKSIDIADNSFNPDAHSVRIWHQNDLAQHVGRGKHIGFPIFELDTFNRQEKHHLGSCDELIVCSDWAKEIVKDQVDVWDMNEPPPRQPRGPKVHVVPLGVDTELFPTTLPKKKDKVVFLNCGKWEVRKGHDILIEAFRRAYKHCPNIELWMMCSNPFNTPQEDAKWTNMYRHPAIKLIPRADTQSGVYNIMAQADCGVFPSRGEGWNLELLEMMAVGRHVIATNYSAHTQFCNIHNSRLVDVAGLELAYDNKWFFGQGKWAKLDETTIEDLSLAMRNFVEYYDFSINKDGVETAKAFSWQNSARALISAIH
jgi:glycosyltransferase involved in cell wall biosynthesis